MVGDGQELGKDLRRGEVAAKAGILAFAEELRRLGIPTSIRFSRGQDVGAACGQLALKAPKALTFTPTLEGAGQ